MRTIFDTSGNDITSFYQSAVVGDTFARSFGMCNLYTFINRAFWTNSGSSGACAAWTFTDYDAPLTLGQYQLFAQGAIDPTSLNGSSMFYYQPSATSFVGQFTFLPEKIQRDKLIYGVGLDANDITLDWFIDDNTDYFAQVSSGSYPTLISPPTSFLSMKQMMSDYRVFDDCPFWIHRGITVDAIGPIVNVLGTSSPWNPTDANYPYSAPAGGNQTASILIPCSPGQYITIAYVGGAVIQGGIPYSPVGQGYGSTAFGLNPWPSDRCFNGGYPQGSNVGLVGCFVNNLGVVQQQPIQLAYLLPYTVGPAPAGATAFSLGVNTYQNWAQNTGQWFISYSIAGKTVPQSTPFLVGTSLMYRGFLRKVEASAEKLRLTLGSLMQIIQDLQVPTQLIMPGNRNVQFLPSTNPSNSTLTTPIAATAAPNVFTFTAATTLTANQLQDCWVVFQPNLPSTLWAPQNGLPPISTPGFKIRTNTAAAALATTTVTFYDPPVIPGSPAAVNVFTQTSGTAPGFNNVPPPEVSV